MSTLKKIYLKSLLTTYMNEKGEEKKNFKSLLPYGWNEKTFDYSDVNNVDTDNGYVYKCGAANGIMVLDCDNADAYITLCNIYKQLNLCYTVKTRRGYHVYFKYDPNIKKIDISGIDFQSDNKLIVGPTTQCRLLNGKVYEYKYKGGSINEMPKCIYDRCILKENHHAFISNVKYEYHITDDETREILKKIQESHSEYFLDRNKWLILTSIMKTINKFDIWDEFCKGYINYDKNENIKTWNTCKLNISINFFCKLLKLPYVKYHKFINENDLIDKYNLKCTSLNQTFINIELNDFLNSDTLILNSNTGTGKTTMVANACSSYILLKPEISVLSIVNLISLADQQCITFKKKHIDLLNYRDKEINQALLMHKNSVICINSLFKLADCDFTNKIVYIDEVHSLLKTLTHSTTIKEHKLVTNTLIRIVNECHKLVISDAHIFDNTMLLLIDRINNKKLTYKYFKNTYNKFSSVEAIKYTNENLLYNVIENKVLNNLPFSFCSDSKGVITDWYNALKDKADEKTQENMLLYTGETDEKICDDWTGKLIFYSPKISTGVDISIKSEKTEQFVYITGKSVDSIQLFQMATRTRNMLQMHYYSCAPSKLAQYENIKDCEDKKVREFLQNKLSISSLVKPEFVLDNNEKIYSKIFYENVYRKDYYSTNIEYFFEQELSHAGFKIIKTDNEYVKLNDDLKQSIKQISQDIANEKFDLVKESINEQIKPEGISNMTKRIEILKISDAKVLDEYRDIIEDEYKFEHFLNYNRLNKSLDYCQQKLNAIVDSKMLFGVESNVWSKIKYVHMLAEVCNIKDNVFDIKNINVSDIKDEKVLKLIDTIKILYNKRDKCNADSYDVNYIIKTYKFMLDNLIKKLGLIISCKNKKGDLRDKHTYTIDKKIQQKYDRLRTMMNKDEDSCILNLDGVEC